jgi:hypothetical protein
VRTRSLVRHAVALSQRVIGGIAVARLTTPWWPANAAASADRSSIDTIAGVAPWAVSAAALAGVRASAVTEWPCWTNAGIVWRPIAPVPPVTNTLISELQSFRLSRRLRPNHPLCRQAGDGDRAPLQRLAVSKRVSQTLMKRCARLIEAGRNDGSIPPGPPAKAVALAFWGALEGAVIALAGQAPHDELLAARTVAGVLGLDRPGARPSA